MPPRDSRPPELGPELAPVLGALLRVDIDPALERDRSCSEIDAPGASWGSGGGGGAMETGGGAVTVARCDVGRTLVRTGAFGAGGV